MQQDVTRKAVKPVFPRGLIVALLIGVGMVYVPYLYQLVSRVSIYRLYVYVDYFVIAQIASITVAIVFLNRNRIVSIGAMAVFCVCLALSRSFFPEMRTVFSDAIRGEYFDIKYLSFTYFRVIEFILAALVLFGMNKGIKPVSVTAAVLLTAVTAWWTFKTRMSLPSFTSQKQIYAAMFLYCAYYGELFLPVLLLVCALKPGCIHTGIKVIDSFMAVRIVLFLAGDLLLWMNEVRYYNFHLNVLYLTGICWLPLMMIFGMNAVLLFPIPFRRLAKVFGMSLFVVALIAVMAAAQQSSENNDSKQSGSGADTDVGDLLESLPSWEKSGAAADFSAQSAQRMLNEGRITQKQYRMLVNRYSARR